MREATNFCAIEGILNESDIKNGTYEKDGKTIETIYGEITILVHETINNQTVDILVPVHLYSNKLKKDGTLSPAYTAIEAIRGMNSIASTGSEATADKVRCVGSAKYSNAQLRMNTFVGRDGRTVSYPQVNASFVSKSGAQYNPQAKWNLEFVVKSMNFVTDAEGIELEPKKLAVEVIVPLYGGKVNVMTLYATTPSVIAAVQNNWEIGQTYSAKGRLNFTTTERHVTIDSDFGEPEERTYTNRISELVITGGSTSPNEIGFDMSEINAGLKALKDEIESKKNQAPKKTPAPATQNSGLETIDLGF